MIEKMSNETKMIIDQMLQIASEQDCLLSFQKEKGKFSAVTKNGSFLSQLIALATLEKSILDSEGFDKDIYDYIKKRTNEASTKVGEMEVER